MFCSSKHVVFFVLARLRKTEVVRDRAQVSAEAFPYDDQTAKVCWDKGCATSSSFTEGAHLGTDQDPCLGTTVQKGVGAIGTLDSTDLIQFFRQLI